MTYLLDTNVCVAYLRGDEPEVRDRIRDIQADHLALCSVVKAELLFGARNSGRVEANLGRLARFFAPLRSLSFDDAAAEHYGVLRARLRREGAGVGANDMMIAAIALSADATLVTRDERELSRIAGLRLVTW